MGSTTRRNLQLGQVLCIMASSGHPAPNDRWRPAAPASEATRATTKQVNGRQSSKGTTSKRRRARTPCLWSRDTTSASQRGQALEMNQRPYFVDSARQAATGCKLRILSVPACGATGHYRQARPLPKDVEVKTTEHLLSSRRLLPRRMHAEDFWGPPFNSKVFLQRL